MPSSNPPANPPINSHTGPQRVLAFDFGVRHIGTAVGQTITGTASPATTLAADNGTPDWAQVLQLVKHWQPQALLVGLPLNMDDSESEMSANAREFAQRLGARTKLPVHLVDERLSSYAVREQTQSKRPESRKHEKKGQGNRRSQTSHDLAAVLIAQTYLGELG